LSEEKTQDTNTVECVGWVRCAQGMLGEYVQVMLSDGRIADSRYGEVQKIERWKVRAFDEDFKIRMPVATGSVIQETITPTYYSSAAETPEISSPVVGSIPRRQSPSPSFQGVQSRMSKPAMR